MESEIKKKKRKKMKKDTRNCWLTSTVEEEEQPSGQWIEQVPLQDLNQHLPERFKKVYDRWTYSAESKDKIKNNNAKNNFSEDQRKSLEELADFKAEVESMEGEVKIKMIGLLKDMEELEEIRKDAEKAEKEVKRKTDKNDEEEIIDVTSDSSDEEEDEDGMSESLSKVIDKYLRKKYNSKSLVPVGGTGLVTTSQFLAPKGRGQSDTNSSKGVASILHAHARRLLCSSDTSSSSGEESCSSDNLSSTTASMENLELSANSLSTANSSPSDDLGRKTDTKTPVKKVCFVQKSQTILLNRSNIHGGMAIMDSGCERECAGKLWTEAFVRNLSPEDRKKVVRVQDDQQFKFGDGICVQAAYSIKCPVYVAGIRMFMCWAVLETDLPLLVSLPVMKRLEISITYHTGGDRARVLGREIKLPQLDGHQWISLDKKGSIEAIIGPVDEKIQDTELEAQEVLLLSGKVTKENVKSVIRKLHTNYAHLSAQGIYGILRDCGRWESSMSQVISQVLEECPHLKCRKRGNIVRNPVSNFSRIKAPGELVAVDLKIRSNESPILYAVDYCTGYITGAILPDKTADSAAQGLWKCWYAAGLPIIRTCLSDNGREFTELSDEDALTWACVAYNNLETRAGYSPAHLLFGVSPGEISVEDMGLGDCLLEEDEYRKQQQEEADPEIVQENHSSRSSTTVGYHHMENRSEESSFSVEQNDQVQTDLSDSQRHVQHWLESDQEEDDIDMVDMAERSDAGVQSGHLPMEEMDRTEDEEEDAESVTLEERVPENEFSGQTSVGQEQGNGEEICLPTTKDSNCDKTFLFDLDKVAWTDPEIEINTSKHGIPEIEEGKNEKLESSGAFKPVRLNSLSEDQKAKGIATTWTEVYKAHANDGKEDLVTVQGEDGAMATMEGTSTKLKVPANSPLNGESEAAIAAQVVEEDNRIVSWLSGVLQPVEIRKKPAVNSRVVKTLMSSETFRTPMVFMIWLFLMMMVVRFDLQFFSLNAVKERVYDSVNKEVVE